MKVWLERGKVKLGGDFSRYRTVYQRGQVAEVVSPHPTPRELDDMRHLKAVLTAAGVFTPLAA